MKFTTRSIEALKATGKREDIWETGRNGFGVRLSASGTVSWQYMYRFDGLPRRMTLGKFPMMGLADAHEAHARAEKQKSLGFDPAAEKVSNNVENRKMPTVEGLITQYLDAATKKSIREDKGYFNKNIIPNIGRRKADKVKRRDINAILDEIVTRGAPIAANRTLAALRKMYNWAISRDILEFNPCTAISPPGKEQSRDRVLSNDELKCFMQNLPKADMLPVVKLAMQFQLITLQRKGEVVGMEWAEVDLNAKIWTIPNDKAKNGKSHRVPLSEMAINILAKAQKLKGKGDWVFPSRLIGRQLTADAVSKALRKNREHLGVSGLTPHDLRRTGASHLASMGIPRLHISKILNHVESGVTAVYDRYSYDNEKERALDVWGQKLNQIVNEEQGSSVVVGSFQ